MASAYNTLIERLGDACAQANAAMSGNTQPVITLNANNDIDLNAIVHIRCKARKTPLSVVIHAQEEIRKGTKKLPPQLVRSTVRVYYYKIEEDVQANLLHSVHFDYGAVRDCHPIFHAQISNEHVDIDENTATTIAFDYLKQESLPSCFREARIPTSDMTLPSVLLCIAADHFRPAFPEFYKTVCRLQENLPLPQYELTRTSMRQRDEMPHLRSSHWFAHMQG